MQAAAALACPSSAYAGDVGAMDGLTLGRRDAWLVGLCADRLTVLCDDGESKQGKWRLWLVRIRMLGDIFSHS